MLSQHTRELFLTTWDNRADCCSRQASNCTHATLITPEKSFCWYSRCVTPWKKNKHTHTVVSSSQKKAQRGRSSQWRESMSHYIFCLKLNLRDGLISKGFEAWGREECPSKSLTAPNLTPVKVSSADGSPNHEADCCGLTEVLLEAIINRQVACWDPTSP